MKIETLERYIKKTYIPYGDLLNRAEKGGLLIEKIGGGTVFVREKNSNKKMILFFESDSVFKQNKDNGLIATHYNY